MCVCVLITRSAHLLLLCSHFWTVLCEFVHLFVCVCVCEGISLCLCVSVFMHDFPSFSKVPYGRDLKAGVADKADNFQPYSPDFLQMGDWREITLGVNMQFTTQPGGQN